MPSRSPVRARPAHARHTRRGSVYLLVLGTGVITCAVALGALAVARSGTRSVVSSRDWDAAGIAAQSGVELAAARLNADAVWRDSLAAGATSSFAVGPARLRLSYTDETTPSFNDNVNDPVRVYAAARVGDSVRVFSASLAPIDAGAYDVLSSAVHAAAGVTTSGNLRVAGGPITTTGTLTNSGTLLSDVEAGTITNSGFILGTTTTPSPAKTLPSSTDYAALSSAATNFITIGFTPTLNKLVMSAGANPFGPPNARGVYRLTIFSSQTVTITNSRLNCTLIVAMNSPSKLIIKAPVLWEPPSPTLPSLIVTANGSGCSVEIDGSAGSTTLSESVLTTNFNPTTTPYQGASDSDQTDTYPSKLSGAFVIVGAACPLSIVNSPTIEGIVVTGGSASIQNATIATIPSMLAAPPLGLGRPSGGMLRPVSGSFRWETLQSFATAAGVPVDSAAP